MEFNSNGIILILFGLSVVSFVVAIIIFIKQNKGKSVPEKLVIPSCFLFLSIFFHRYIIGFYKVISENEKDLIDAKYNLVDELFLSLKRTMQTFSLDENYLNSIIEGKNLFIKEFDWYFLYNFYGLFASFLNVCAPIVGGAFLLGILTGIFPRLRLFFKPFKEKYVFSELNDRAVCFAEDIIEQAKEKPKSNNFFAKLVASLKSWIKRPFIIFTDTYIDPKNEANSELVQRAKDTGAVCIKNDILKLSFSHTKKIHYILIDNEDISNINTLINLVSEENKCFVMRSKGLKGRRLPCKLPHWKKECYVYLLSQNPEASTIIKMLNVKKDIEKPEIIIKLVQEYTKIVYNLFNDVPLYKPLLAKGLSKYSDKKELILTIIGGGQISTEVFLGAYWCGQMLNCKLRINVITKNAQKFKAKINYINQQILLSGIENQELLRVYPNKDICADPYASFFFYSVNVKSDKFFDILDTKDGATGFSILSSDYFVIALGSDDLNISTAVNIERKIGREALNESVIKKPVIAYSVFDSKINEELNNHNSQNSHAYLYAFASLKNIYNCKNIFMNDIREHAFDINRKHNKENEKEFMKNEYDWWSSIARVLHINYKMYSAGLEEKEYREVIRTYNIGDDKLSLDNKIRVEKLSWLEHRRWNAFMRTKGFIAPTDFQFDQYAFKNGNNHKNISLKLHPFIVESSESIQITKKDLEDYKNNEKLDCLDIASITKYLKELKEKGKADLIDYKIFDNPAEDLKEEEKIRNINKFTEDNNVQTKSN